MGSQLPLCSPLPIMIHAMGMCAYAQEKHIREDLRRLLPRDDKPVEKPAEAAFRQRM